MITCVGISRDHSASMRPITVVAAKDYNECISSIKDAALREKQDTFVSVVESGAGNSNLVRLVERSKYIEKFTPMPESSYIANGTGTPLFDSVGELIELFESESENFGWPNHNRVFLIMVITDGLENASRRWNGPSLAKKIAELQGTDRWTFTFRVPKGHKKGLVRLGIPEGNILEWEQTVSGMETSTRATSAAVSNYFSGIKSGVTSTKSFYVDLSSVSSSDVKTTLVSIPRNKIVVTRVMNGDPLIIKNYVNFVYGKESFEVGSFYYQLTKSERVQENKNIIIYDGNLGVYYTGRNARDLLGIPYSGTIHLLPSKHSSNYDIFVQSTSHNRKLVVGTEVLKYIS